MQHEADIKEIAYEHGLEIIETTTGRNGYPQELKHAIIGFSTFREAEELAERYGLKITSFFKKEGWQLWYRSGDQCFSPFRIKSEDYGDDYRHHYCSDDRTFFEDEVKPRLENFNDLDSLERFIRDSRKLLDEIESIDDSQLVISYMGRYYETIDMESMEWCHDGKFNVIGVMKP